MCKQSALTLLAWCLALKTLGEFYFKFAKGITVVRSMSWPAWAGYRTMLMW